LLAALDLLVFRGTPCAEAQRLAREWSRRHSAAMIRIAITAEAFEAVSATLPLGTPSSLSLRPFPPHLGNRPQRPPLRP
jgi:hypothetical protein